VKVTGRIPHVIPPNEFNRFYLETKARRSGHMMDLAEERLPEQSDPVLIEGMPR
jgi:GTP cyclohydrolase II